MVYFTQLIYIKEGQEKVFNQFENVAIPIIAKYKGQLLLRVRPMENSFIEHQIEKPMKFISAHLKMKKTFRISCKMKNGNNFYM